LIAWVIEHNSHGIVFDTLVFLPEGEEPETKEEWRRMPWLDQSLAPFDPKICAFAGCGKPSHGLFGGDGPGTGVPKCVDHCREDLPIRREAAHVDQLRAWQLERELANQAAQTKLAEIGAKLVEAAKQQDPKFPPGWDNDLPLKPRFHSTVEREEYESRERAKKIALDLRTGKKIEEAFIEAAINDPATDVKTAVKAAMDRVARVGVHYEMGRADERIGSDKLLGEAESAISSWISVSIPRAAGALYELLERIRAYRKGTEAMREAGIKRGWYPKDSS
jgi:hypothetical protein